MEIIKFTVEIEEQKCRLDVFLQKNLVDKSRSFVQKNIKAGNVKVNNEVEKVVHYWLKNDDVIDWRENIVTKTQTSAKQLVPDIEVIYECDDYIIINKPSKLLVHALPNKPNVPSLIDWLIAKYPQTKQLGENPLRPALVHRLDKEVSGLMVIPLNQKMHDYLKTEFKLRRVEKEYTALSYGSFQDVEGDINLPISRSKNTGKMAAHSVEQGGKKAFTHFEVIKNFVNFTLLKINIKTGRTNQIRVHLQALGHSLVGDTLYTNKNITKPIKLDQVFLHANHLSFNLESGKMVEYSCPLPKILANFLETLTKTN